MKNKYKAILNLLLAGLLFISLFSGCSRQKAQEKKPEGDNKKHEPIVEETKLEPIVFTVWQPSSDPGAPPEEDLIHKYIREKLGVDIRFEYTAGDAKDKLNLMLASGDYPDALFMKPDNDVKRYVVNDHIVEISSYLQKYCADLYDLMRSWNQDQYAERPGKIYYVPGEFGYSKEYPLIEPMLGIRYDAWEKIGKPMPKDLEEFYEVAKKMQDAVPEEEGKKTYAFSGWFGDSWGQWAPYAIQRYAGIFGWNGAMDANDDWKYSYFVDSEEWLYAMRFLNRAYREGYGDPEASIMKYDQYMNKLKQGLILVNYYAGDWLDGEANRARNAAGKPEQRFFPYPFMKYPNYDGKPLTGQYFPRGGGYSLFITKKCTNPEEIIKRLSYLYTDEGQVLTGMGIEGIHWTKDEKGFRKPIDQIIEMAKNDPDYTLKTGINRYRIFGSKSGFDPNGDAYDLNNNKYYKQATYDEIDFKILKSIGHETYDTLPRVGMTREDHYLGNDYDKFNEGTDLAIAKTKMDHLIPEYVTKLYVARSEQHFDEIVREWKKKAEVINYQKVIEEINKRISKQVEVYKATIR